MTSESPNTGITSHKECFDADHTDKLCAAMYDLNKDGAVNDVFLVAGGDKKRIPASRLVLAAASPYFKALLMGQMRETDQEDVIIEEVTGDSLQALIRFCFIGKIDITSDNVDDLLDVASRLEMTQVEELCEQKYREMLSMKNCLGLWLLADQYKFYKLKEISRAMAMESFVQLQHEEEFRNLKKEGLQMLLADEDLFVFSEEDVFEALVGWIRVDEDERKAFFAELVKLVRLNQMAAEFFTSVLSKYASWASLDLFNELVKMHLNADDDSAKPRFSLTRPTLLIVGTDAHKSDDRFTVAKLSHLRNDCFEIASFPGYRSGHSVVQAGKYLYILGGMDSDGNTLKKVQRLNLRNWTCEELKPMAHERANFASVHLENCIYAIGGNFHPSSDEDISLSVERYDILEDEWSEVDPLDDFDLPPSHIEAIALRGQIFVVFQDGMSCYDPMFDEWRVCSPLPRFGTRFSLFIGGGKLRALSYESGNNGIQRNVYDASSNQWEEPENRIYNEYITKHIFTLGHGDLSILRVLEHHGSVLGHYSRSAINSLNDYKDFVVVNYASAELNNSAENFKFVDPNIM